MKPPKIDSFKSPRTPTPEAVSMPETARPLEKKDSTQAVSSNSTERMNGDTERSHRTVTKQVQTTSVLEELNRGALEVNKRPTERYSFEIYTDQKQKIRDLQYRYEKKMGKRLSSSRIIREALEMYLDDVLNPGAD